MTYTPAANGRVYLDLLSNILATTDSLVEAVRSTDEGQITQLLKVRKTLCAGLAGTSPSLADFMRGLNDHIGDDLKHQIQHLADSILERQSECEELLSGKLLDCRSKLVTLGRSKKLRNLYQGNARRQTAVFLDSRL